MTLLPPPTRPAVTAAHEFAWRHFEQRLRERHGLTLGLIEYTRLCLEIAGQDLTLSPLVVSRPTRRTVLLRLRIQGTVVPCVWRPEPGLLVTAYTNDMTFRTPGQVKAGMKEKARRMRRKLARYRRHPKHRGRDA